MNAMDAKAVDLINANATLRERVRILEDRLVEFTGAPTAFQFSRAETRLFSALMKSIGLNSRELMDVHMRGHSWQPKQIHTILTTMFRIRLKLAPFDLHIHHDRGGGYWLTLDAKTKVRAMMRAEGLIE